MSQPRTYTLPMGPPGQRNRRRWVAVAYDIVDDRRRTKVMKTLAGYGQRVQYSVFECELRAADFDNLCRRLTRLIQADEDDVRLYPLCDNCLSKVVTLGRAQTHRHQSHLILKRAPTEE